jgi:hypothetical protein
MNMLTRFSMTTAAMCIVLSLPAGCGEDPPAPAPPAGIANAPAATNRIAIPPSVRSNLGIRFAPAERRRIEDTLRAPGTFEYLPTAKREYRTMLPGRIDILVNQFDHVEPGTPLYRLDSPDWRNIQQNIARAESDVNQLETTLRTFGPLRQAHQRHEQSLRENIAVWEARVAKLDALREAGGGRMSEFTAARSALTTAEAELANMQEKDAELEAEHTRTITAIAAARSNLALTLDAAAAILDVDRGDLLAPTSAAADAPPLWRTITSIEVTARQGGVVESVDLTNGAWADAQTNVMTVVQPDKLRFHASGLQSDLGVLRDGLRVTIVPPTPTAGGTAVPMQDVMRGTLTLGLAGDSKERTVDLYITPESLAAWARPGVTAQLEIVTADTSTPELAIPLAAVQRDGLNPVIFRRNPDNPNEAIRMEADLGVDDGRWVAVLSGLRDGDEVVLDGGFQLMLATSGSIQKGGHFHSDGTFHGEDH